MAEKTCTNGLFCDLSSSLRPAGEDPMYAFEAPLPRSSMLPLFFMLPFFLLFSKGINLVHARFEVSTLARNL